MGQIWNALVSAFEWCTSHPFLMFWILLPAVYVFIYAAYKIFILAGIRKNDCALIRELVEYKKVATQQEHPDFKRADEYIKILSESPKNNISLVLYKYVIAHKDFSNILSYFSYPEYSKVGRAGNNRRKYKKIWVLNILGPIFAIWAVFVNIANATNNFEEAVVNGGLTRSATNAMVIPGMILLFSIAVTVLLFLYRRSVAKYKIEILAKLGDEADEFFAGFGNEYLKFACDIISITNPSEKVHTRIIKLLTKEGIPVNNLIFTQCKALTYGVTIETAQAIEPEFTEDEEENIPAPELKPEPENDTQPAEIEEEEGEVMNESRVEPELSPVPEIVEELSVESEPVKEGSDIEEILQKFEDMPFVPPASMDGLVEVETKPEPALEPAPAEHKLRKKPETRTPDEEQVEKLLSRLEKPKRKPSRRISARITEGDII